MRVGDAVVGRVTSGGFGYTVNAPIAYAYLPIASAEPGTRVELDMFGDWVGGVVAKDGALRPEERARPRLAKPPRFTVALTKFGAGFSSQRR